MRIAGWATPLFLVATITTTAYAEAPASTVTMASPYMTVPRAHPDLVVLRRQMAAHPELPPIEFWTDYIARCETGRQADGTFGEWDRGKDWGPRARSWVSGGLGLAHTTWRGYGGRQFARKAALASKWAQIVVANRVGFIGWQTKEFRTWDDRQNNRPLFRDAAGFDQGWGGVCYRQWKKENRK